MVRIAEWRRLGVLVDGAELCSEFRAQLQAVQAAMNEELLDLAAASAHSGFSTDHLRRLSRTGKLVAVRKGRRLYFRRGELPAKPRLVDAGPSSYDPVADARQLAVRRSRKVSDNA